MCNVWHLVNLEVWQYSAAFGTLRPKKRNEISGCRAFANARAFTLVELLVVIAVLAILVGLLSPTLSGVSRRARLTRELLNAAQLSASVTQYTAQCKDVFPLVDENPFRCSWNWPRALVASGLLDNETQADAVGYRSSVPENRYHQSVCMTYDPERMVIGQTVSEVGARSTSVMLSNVTFPSRKVGLLLRRFDIYDSQSAFCCASPTADVPVALVDGSTIIGNSHRMVWHAEQITVVDGIGVPGYSTWGGYKSFDLP